MKSIIKYSFALAATAMMMTACSSDEPATPDNGFVPGESAYLNVQLRTTDDLTRAGEGTDITTPPTEGFEDGTGNESTVSSAYFYFFDANGIYVGQSNIWGGKAPGENPNIEFKSNSVVVLDNLKGHSYPTYMVTVLNGTPYPNSDLGGKTLAEFSRDLTNWGTNAANGFVMATTSYFDASGKDINHADFGAQNIPTYYATKLDQSNFAQSEEAALATSVPAVVYVERLAARVKLTTPSNTDTFPIDVTVMGADNDNPSLGSGETAAGTKLQVKILGWYLNGVQENSYLLKQFGSWSSAASLAEVNNWAWNLPGYHRSFWGQGVNYGELADTNLLYYSWAGAAKNDIGGVAYCNENTTNKTNLTVTGNDNPNQQLLTSVVVKAEVQYAEGDKNGQAVDMVEHNGVYFEKTSFLKYILGIASNKKQLNYYTRTGTEESNYTYTQVGPEYFELAGDNNHVYVKKSSTFPANSQLWMKGADGKYTQTGVDASGLDDQLKAINSSDKTTAFTGGAMYYNIPIQHLNTITRDADKKLTAYYEGSYGVVRNHAYNVNITSVKRLGYGVFNKDTEQIKPTPTPPEEANWFLGATINVLSWKIVTSNVEL